MEWKEQWAIIYQGVLSLCKERHVSLLFVLMSTQCCSCDLQDTHVAFSAPLSTLMSIRDSAHLTLPAHARRLRPKSSSSSSNVLCVKISAPSDLRQRTFSNESSLSVSFAHVSSSYPSSTGSQGAWWKRGSRDVSSALSLGLASGASVIVGSWSGAGLADVWPNFARRGRWIVLDDANCEGPPRERWGYCCVAGDCACAGRGHVRYLKIIRRLRPLITYTREIALFLKTRTLLKGG